MSDGLLFPLKTDEGPLVRTLPNWVVVHRRGPILRPSRSVAEAGVFGLDLTAGCALGCPFCHIRALPTYPGPNEVLYDPSLPRRLEWTLDAMETLPRLVVLSPSSDPFPPHRDVRKQAEHVIRLLAERRIPMLIMTRGRIPLRLLGPLKENASRVTVAVPFVTLDRTLSRTLEPRCAAPAVRLARLGKLLDAHVPVEVRLEPLVAGLTDTRDNIRPLFRGLARLGVNRVIAHYLFLHPALSAPLKSALESLGFADRLDEEYESGPIFSIGSLGSTRHLRLEARQAGLASLSAWGAEFGIEVETGAAQNPDLPRADLAEAAEAVSRPMPRPGTREPRTNASAGHRPFGVKAGN
jgi:DNA repair photolyase